MLVFLVQNHVLLLYLLDYTCLVLIVPYCLVLKGIGVRLVGHLLYLGFTRPITYGVQQLSQHLQHPRHIHWNNALHLVKYLKGTISQSPFYPAQNSLTFQAFCDADWASRSETRNSLIEFCVYHGRHSFISWKTKKHLTISRSSVEAKYGSLATTVSEKWISFLLRNFSIPV